MKRGITAMAGALLASGLLVVGAGATPPSAGWTTQSSGLTATLLDSVSFPTCLHGWAVGSLPDSTEPSAFDKSLGTVIHTTNGGQTWAPAQFAAATLGLESVYFVDDAHGWIGTQNGTVAPNTSGSAIFYTTNAGSSWTQVNIAGANDIEGLWFASTLVGYASADGGSALYRTTDGGHTWTLTTTPSGSTGIEGLGGFDATHVWAGTDRNGVNSILGTSNGTSFAGQAPTAGNEYEGIAAVSATSAWAAGTTRVNSSSAASLLHTTDGSTWVAQAIPAGITSTDLESVAFPDATHGWFVSSAGEIAATTNSGTTWTQQTSPVTGELSQVVFRTAARGWSVGANGQIVTYKGAPVITSVSPASGPIAGGTAVTLKGCGLTGTSSVSFGGTAGTNVVVVNDGQVTVTAPAHASGPVNVTLTNPFGTSAVSAADIFTFVAPTPTPRPSATPILPRAGGAPGSDGSPLAMVGLILLAGLVIPGAARALAHTRAARRR